MVELSVAEANTLTICGDTHGIRLFELKLNFQANFTMFLKFLEETDIPHQLTNTSSMATLSTVDPGPQKSHSSYTPSRSFIQRESLSTVATTKQMI